MVTISGGDKFEAALKSIATSLGSAKVLRVGFLEDATYPAGKVKALRTAYKARKKAKIEGAVTGALYGTSVAMVAAIQNYGAPKAGIPPRPFFSNMIADKSPEWPAAIGKQLVRNNYDADKTLRIVGEAIRGQLQKSIRDTDTPPLKQATIDRKGFSKPLIDTAHMINSVDYDITS